MSVRKVKKGELVPAPQKSRVPCREDLTVAQQELLGDLRESLKQVKRGELLPAREALREVRLELEAEDDANSSDT